MVHFFILVPLLFLTVQAFNSTKVQPKIITENHFCVRQRFELLLFKTKHFATPNKLFTYRKINLLLTNSIYLFFFSLKNQRRLAQSKVHYKFFSLKKNDSQTFKRSNAKSVYCSVHVIGTTFFH